jgi:hypothetical protein
MKIEIRDVIKFKSEEGETRYSEIEAMRKTKEGVTYEVVNGNECVEVKESQIISKMVEFKSRAKKEKSSGSEHVDAMGGL